MICYLGIPILGAKLRPGNVHSAEDWDELLLPEIERQQAEGKQVTFRADAAFAKPEIYEAMEERGVDYVIRIPANKSLELEIEDILFRPPGRPNAKPLVRYKSFRYQAESWSKARRVVAKVEHSSKEKAIYLLDRKEGVDGRPLGRRPVPSIGRDIRLTAEVRGRWAVVSITDGERTYSSPIVAVSNTAAGGVGLRHEDKGAEQSFDNFEVRRSPKLVKDEHLERKLRCPAWRISYSMIRLGRILPGRRSSSREKIILLDAYRPSQLPLAVDRLLARISILVLARSQYTPALPRRPRLFVLNPAHHLRR